MEHTDHVQLLKHGVSRKGGVWADVGSGTGAFTLALRELLGKEGVIYSVDMDAKSLSVQQSRFENMFPNSHVIYQTADFTKPLHLPRLDGIVMANSLHFVKEQSILLQKLKGNLKPRGIFLLVEYNVDVGNSYVPYPLSYNTWKEKALEVGFQHVSCLSSVPSQFLKEIYAAQAINR